MAGKGKKTDKRHSGTRSATTAKAGKRSKRGKNKKKKRQNTAGQNFSFGHNKYDGTQQRRKRSWKKSDALQQQKEALEKQKQEYIERRAKKFRREAGIPEEYTEVSPDYDPTSRELMIQLGLIKRREED